jgi:hypothetical protein
MSDSEKFISRLVKAGHIVLEPRGELPLRDLPNIHGYVFYGVRWDGSAEYCRVIKCDDGLHRIEGGKYPDLRSWKEAVQPSDENDI